ncbi:gamma-aminobutyric acid type B receptor subunit 1-like [Amphiura filiformis]|uniref:gamma-aminobutyric acid type B receptor subunit 1-like n=1 Tax=Amphiura filiformis TaxID=82378 RepID=UPI003B21CAA7
MVRQGVYFAVVWAISLLSLTLAKTPLYILGLYPMTGAWDGGTSFLPATQLALEHINANQSLLGDFELILISRDTGCHTGKGTDAMYEELYDTSKVKIMVFGAGCSTVTEPTAQMTPLWNLIQLSHSSSSPKLSDRNLFPRFFRMYPPLTVFNDVIFAILKYYGWTKVATLHQTLDLFSLPTSDFLNQADDNGIDVITSESFADDPSIQVANLKRQGARIIIGNFYEDKARLVFCAAYKQRMFGAKYLWIINGWYGADWWKQIDESNPEGCTVQEMEQAVEGYLANDALSYSVSEEPGITGITAAEFLEQLGDFVNDTYGVDDLESLTGWRQSSLGYDGAWTIALTLQKANQMLQELDPSLTVANFTYDQSNITDLFFSIIENIRFEGVSGPVQFTSSGDRRGLMEIEQNQNGSEIQVGRYNPSNKAGHELVWTNNPPVYWEGGNPPADSVKVRENYITISTSVFAAMLVISVLGIILATAFLAFNIAYRNKRNIKMSSPNLNNILIFGGILAYMTIIFAGFDTATVDSLSGLLAMCKTTTWFISVGFSLAFGSMFSKTWRVHKIFTSKTVKKVSIKDYQLAGLVAILILIDVFVLTLWEIVDPVTLVERRGNELQHPDKEDVVIIPIHISCESVNQIYFEGTLLGIKGLLLIFGAFLSYETRKVTVPALNDSKYIGISIYNIVILSFVGVPVSIILDDVDAHYVITGVFIFVSATGTLCLIFLPKVRSRNEVHPTGTMITMPTTSDEGDKDKKIRELEKNVKELRQRLNVNVESKRDPSTQSTVGTVAQQEPQHEQ